METLEKIRLHGLWLKGEQGGVEANLEWANLSFANLSFANLSLANLSWADLGGADLRGADLRGAHLGGANLSGVDLSGANLSGANLSEAKLGWADLSEATGNGKEIKSAHVHTYSMVWHKDRVWIGCMCKTLEEWERFNPCDLLFEEEDCAAWEKHKDWILETVRRFPAE